MSVDKGATYDNVRGVFADLDDGGLTDDEALTKIREIVAPETISEPWTRDYTIHLRISGMVVGVLDTDTLDRIVQDVVDASTARDAIETGLDNTANASVQNFYMVDAKKPEGGID